MTLGEKLLELRQARGWSQRELARRSMVRHALINQLERGRRHDTTGRNLRRLALVLHVSIDYGVCVAAERKTGKLDFDVG